MSSSLSGKKGSVGRFKDRQNLIYQIFNQQLLSNTCDA